MIDRTSRGRLALALRRYVAGRIHNDDLDGTHVDWRDRGAVAIKQMAWNLYNDTYQHFAVGKNVISRKSRRAIARWIVFLHSDREYLWPEYSFEQVSGILTFVLFSRRCERLWKEFCATGDIESWPFQNESEMKAETLLPRLLSGRPNISSGIE